jgi:putative flippase GtrA
MKLAFTYSVFAIIATLANIGVQDVVIRLYYSSLQIPISIIAGTGIGLLIKYLLDKRYIFHFQADNAMHDTRTFMLYLLMGILTTSIFWGFEFGFDYLFHSKELRYLGGVIGLAIGYVAKYHLDKHFVFRKETLS